MGKSASGKDAFYKRLLRDPSLPLHKVVMYTTRPMRQDEEDGVQYFFATEYEYQTLAAQNKIIEERVYETTAGPWRYFTADDGQIDLDQGSYLMIATPEAYVNIRAYYGKEHVVPVLISSDDGLLLERALRRERQQETPRYDEMCRRFLADHEDFAPEKLKAAGLTEPFENNGPLEDCLNRIKDFILSYR